MQTPEQPPWKNEEVERSLGLDRCDLLKHVTVRCDEDHRGPVPGGTAAAGPRAQASS
jgi:hypothetical protein